MGSVPHYTERDHFIGNDRLIQDYHHIQAIGRGDTSKVYKIRHKMSGEEYALKEACKIRILAKKKNKMIRNEKAFLTKLYNPFLVYLDKAFQGEHDLYII